MVVRSAQQRVLLWNEIVLWDKAIQHFSIMTIFRKSIERSLMETQMCLGKVESEVKICCCNFSFAALTGYLNEIHNIAMPPSQYWYCTIANYFLFSSNLCSSLLITSMTFSRWYSIIKPHKAASFNTMGRTRSTILGITLFSFFYSVPHWFFTQDVGKVCYPHFRYMNSWYNEAYFWVTMAVNWAVPCISLLIMNFWIIVAISRNVDENVGRTTSQTQRNNSDQAQGPSDRAEKHVYTVLLAVTFTFLILTTPHYVFFFYARTFPLAPTPKSLAIFHLCQQVVHKSFYVNSGINFFLYVLSGKKFRQEVLQLIFCKANTRKTVSGKPAGSETSSTSKF